MRSFGAQDCRSQERQKEDERLSTQAVHEEGMYPQKRNKYKEVYPL